MPTFMVVKWNASDVATRNDKSKTARAKLRGLLLRCRHLRDGGRKPKSERDRVADGHDATADGAGVRKLRRATLLEVVVAALRVGDAKQELLRVFHDLERDGHAEQPVVAVVLHGGRGVLERI